MFWGDKLWKTQCARGLSNTHHTTYYILAKVLAHKHAHTHTHNTLVQGFLSILQITLKNAEDHYRNIEHSPK